MTSRFTAESAGSALRAVAAAAALALGASSSMAGAALSISSFSVTTTPFSGNFAWGVDAYQSFAMNTLEGGGLYGGSTSNFSAANWNLGLNQSAQSANASAAGNLVQFTDVSTQLTTAGFNLAAQASPSNPPPALPNSANASALLAGAFVLLDDNGQAAAGTIMFDVYYTMTVNTPSTTSMRHSQTVIDLLSSSDGGGSDEFSDQLLSSGFSSGVGTTSGHFSWSYVVAAGEAAYFTLSGSAIEVGQVPEPGTYGLAALGLVSMAVIRRRRRTAA